MNIETKEEVVDGWMEGGSKWRSNTLGLRRSTLSESCTIEQKRERNPQATTQRDGVHTLFSLMGLPRSFSLRRMRMLFPTGNGSCSPCVRRGQLLCNPSKKKGFRGRSPRT